MWVGFDCVGAGLRPGQAERNWAARRQRMDRRLQGCLKFSPTRKGTTSRGCGNYKCMHHVEERPFEGRVRRVESMSASAPVVDAATEPPRRRKRTNPTPAAPDANSNPSPPPPSFPHTASSTLPNSSPPPYPARRTRAPQSPHTKPKSCHSNS